MKTKTKTITITAKCVNMFSSTLYEDHKIIGGYQGCVPEWIPNSKANHYGEYVQLSIDLKTGRILNWKTPSEKKLKRTFTVDNAADE